VLADLHLHSHHSDGRLDPASLVDLVADAGVQILALTDHDTTAGHIAAKARAAARGVRFVGGIEMTTYAHGRVIHVLGLGCQDADEGIGVANSAAQTVWDANQLRWINALARDGAEVDAARDFPDHPVRLPVLIERLCLMGLDDGDPKKVHARFKAFFAALPAEAYERLPHPSAAATVIRRAGGAAMIAHPWPLYEAGLAEALVRDCDGLEAIYAAYEPAQQSALAAMAQRAGKLFCGGSDYHGYFESGYRPSGFEATGELLERLTQASL